MDSQLKKQEISDPEHAGDRFLVSVCYNDGVTSRVEVVVEQWNNLHDDDDELR